MPEPLVILSLDAIQELGEIKDRVLLAPANLGQAAKIPRVGEGSADPIKCVITDRSASVNASYTVKQVGGNLVVTGLVPWRKIQHPTLLVIAAQVGTIAYITRKPNEDGSGLVEPAEYEMVYAEELYPLGDCDGNELVGAPRGPIIQPPGGGGFPIGGVGGDGNGGGAPDAVLSNTQAAELFGPLISLTPPIFGGTG